MPDRPHAGDMAQLRLIAEQVADTALVKFHSEHPSIREKSELPAPLKWAAGIAAAVMTAGIVGFCVWMVTTLNEMQLIVARIDERQQLQAGSVDGRIEGLDRRVTQLETYHRTGGGE